MTILSYNELIDLVECGVIENVKPCQIQGASIDVTLGSKLLLESDDDELVTKDKTLPTIELNMTYTYTLDPREFVLAHTEQIINLPDDICAVYYMNSSMARNGLQHMLATFCDPCWHNSVLTLELQNASQRHAIQIKKGMKIGQMVFHKLSSPVPLEKSYAVKGRYNNDLSVQGVK